MNAWVARDQNGDLYLYEEKPVICGSQYFGPEDGFVCCLPEEMYPDVTFENSPFELIVKS